MTDGTKYFQTMEDMMSYYYGDIFSKEIMKDAPAIQSTSGYRNAIYGAKLWSNILTTSGAFGMLPKKPMDKSGYRVITTAGQSSGGGVADGASIPATVMPVPTEITVTPKMHTRTFDMGTILDNLAGRDDVVTFEEFRASAEREFIDCANRALLTDGNTLASNNFESLDRVCASYSEMAGSGYNAGDLDVYSQDRDASNPSFDAYVDHGSTTDRVFNPSQVDTVLTNCSPYWKDGSYANKAILTGKDTLFRWGQNLAPRLRFGDARVEYGVNGVKTMSGVEGGTPISTYYGIPIISDARVAQDTISRIYVLDLDVLWFSTLTPVLYAEVGKSLEEQVLLGKFTREGVYALQGELTCVQFPNQGKVRDLK